MQNPIAEAKQLAAERPFKEAFCKSMQRTACEVPDLAQATRLEVASDVVSILAMKGVEWAVKIMRDTLDGVPVQETKLDAASAAIAGAAAGATAAIISRIEGKLLGLRSGPVVEIVSRETNSQLAIKSNDDGK